MQTLPPADRRTNKAMSPNGRAVLYIGVAGCSKRKRPRQNRGAVFNPEILKKIFSIKKAGTMKQPADVTGIEKGNAGRLQNKYPVAL